MQDKKGTHRPPVLKSGGATKTHDQWFDYGFLYGWVSRVTGRIGRSLLLFMLLFCLSHCAPDLINEGRDATSTPTAVLDLDDAEDEQFRSSITYSLVYSINSSDGATETVRFRNDEGFEIELDEAYIVTRSIELVDCQTTSNDEQGRNTISIISTVFLTNFPQRPSVAFAGHGDGERDESRIERPIVERVTPAGHNTLIVHDVPSTAYCQAHYLIAPAIAEADLGEGVAQSDMLGNTALFRGRYRSPLDDAWLPFEIVATDSWGIVVNLQPLGSDVPQLAITGSDRISIKVSRQIDRMFDGVNWNEMSVSEIERTMLRSITNHTTIWVE